MGSFLAFGLFICGPIIGIIWWELRQRRLHGNYKQQAYRKQVKRAQDHIILGEADGYIVRDAMKQHQRRRR